MTGFSRVLLTMEGLPWGKIIVIALTANILLWLVSGLVEILKPCFYDADEEDSEKNEFYESEE